LLFLGLLFFYCDCYILLDLSRKLARSDLSSLFRCLILCSDETQTFILFCAALDIGISRQGHCRRTANALFGDWMHQHNRGRASSQKTEAEDNE
jgi:hypothetical protein